MLIKELIENLNAECCKDGWRADFSDTCDTLKHGSSDAELHKVAVTMFATIDVLKAAQEWGADFLIVHEPTFFDHMDNKRANDPVIQAKEKIVDACPFAIWRFHDHPHAHRMDMINEGAREMMGLSGHFEGGFRNHFFHLNSPMSVRQLQDKCIAAMGCRHARLCGNPDQLVRTVAFELGSWGLAFDDLLLPEVELVLCGESCEWREAEYVRDATALGFNKNMLFLGHQASECCGMKMLARNLRKKYPELQVTYIASGEPFVS